MNQLNIQSLKPVVQEHISQPVVFAVVSGAHLYGFESVDSDVDIRGCHLPTMQELLRYSQEKDTVDIMLAKTENHNEADIVSHSLLKFLHLLKKPNGYLLEQLYSPLVIETSPIHDKLKELCKNGLCKELSYHYNGFFKNQEGMMEQQQHKDIKLVLYQLRIILTAAHLARTGRIECNINTLNAEHNIFDPTKLQELITLKREQELSQFTDEALKKYWLDKIDAKRGLILELAESDHLFEFDSEEMQSKSLDFHKEVLNIEFK